jgi:hypothetical protein
MNPQVIQLAVLAAAFWFPTLALAALYFFRKLQLQERLQAIERGADLTVDGEATAARTRRSGIVCIASGLGLSGAAVIVAVAAREALPALVGQALAVVPIAIGLGLLLDYRIARRELAGGPHVANGRSHRDAAR